MWLHRKKGSVLEEGALSQRLLIGFSDDSDSGTFSTMLNNAVSLSYVPEPNPIAPDRKHRSALAEMIKQLLVAEPPFIDKQGRKQTSGYILQEYYESYMTEYQDVDLKAWEERRTPRKWDR